MMSPYVSPWDTPRDSRRLSHRTRTRTRINPLSVQALAPRTVHFLRSQTPKTASGN